MSGVDSANINYTDATSSGWQGVQLGLFIILTIPLIVLRTRAMASVAFESLQIVSLWPLTGGRLSLSATQWTTTTLVTQFLAPQQRDLGNQDCMVYGHACSFIANAVVILIIWAIMAIVALVFTCFYVRNRK